MDIDYKQQDTYSILRYLHQYPDGILVDDILLHSGAEKFRVYPALFELEQAGRLEVLEREELGAPRKVRIIEDSNGQDE